ncbi:MAG TPA: DUF885 family protein, partial [Thermoplasmata archaeon]|nr:DUF885 family protein [Thermoplasmata archaeon]
MTGQLPSQDSSDELGAVERAVIDHLFVIAPSYAVFLGLHEYDGRLPDLSVAATDRWVAAAHGLLKRLQELPGDRLSRNRSADRLLLELLLESPLFDLQESRDYERNPMAYIGTISLTPYIARNYAPIEARAHAMIASLRGVPQLLQEAKRRLAAPLPEPFLELTLAMAGGLPSHFADAERAARAGALELGDQVADARQEAERALTAFIDWLRAEHLPKATPDFALGAPKFQKLLWVREGIRTPYGEILERGRADLAQNQARLSEIASAQKPPLPVTELLESLYRDHPSAAELLPHART